jgi:hypothetical protein
MVDPVRNRVDAIDDPDQRESYPADVADKSRLRVCGLYARRRLGLLPVKCSSAVCTGKLEAMDRLIKLS